jgi:hypothetical protein
MSKPVPCGCGFIHEPGDCRCEPKIGECSWATGSHDEECDLVAGLREAMLKILTLAVNKDYEEIEEYARDALSQENV